MHGPLTYGHDSLRQSLTENAEERLEVADVVGCEGLPVTHEGNSLLTVVAAGATVGRVTDEEGSMTRSRLMVAWAACAVLPTLTFAQTPTPPPPADPIPVASVSDKLGLKMNPSAARELDPGNSVTTMLAEPKRLEPFIKGMHEGARVTISCVGTGRIRVEAEEMEPVEHRTTVTLHVGQDGSLTPAAERPPAPAKPPTP